MSEQSGSTGRILAFCIAAATVGFIIWGTVQPGQTALAMAGPSPHVMGSSSSAQASVETLLQSVGRHDWASAYSSLANKSEFTQEDFVRDVAGSYGSLRSYAALTGFDVRPLHANSEEADFRAVLHWSTVVGSLQEARDLKAVKSGDKWEVAWPLFKEPRVPPQVVPVTYLRWDVVYRGAGDDWGAQDVESPHVRIVDMHPLDRGSRGTVIVGELLNEDVVPAYVTVKAALLAKDGSSLATEDAFDKMSHVLLPKQVTPFRIDFQNVRLSQVDSVRMEPASNLVGASADPVVAIQNQHMSPMPDPSLNGELVNQSGQTVNIAHVIATFYDNTGQIVWVSDGYPDRALLPQTPVPFSVSVPSDISAKVGNFRVTTSTYSVNRFE